MYKIFTLPEDFLDRVYKPEETMEFDSKIVAAISGGNPDKNSNVFEELVDLTKSQKKKVDNFPSTDWKVKEAHDKVFGKGNDRIVIPLDRSQEKPITHSDLSNNITDPHYVLKNRLHNHGYHITDYVKGEAKKARIPGSDVQDNRTYKIGKLIGTLKSDRLGQPIRKDHPEYETTPTIGEQESTVRNRAGKVMSVKDAFDSDPMRTNKSGEHVMVVTRNRHDVAGMSTNQNWKSCMDMVEGCNKHYLPEDIRNGTLTAYLAHKDHETKGLKPLGRMNLKRFNSDDRTHMAFVPEGNGYGNLHDTFRKAVKDFAETHYPMGEHTYFKHPSLYNDDGKSTIDKRDYSKADYESGKHIISDLASQHLSSARSQAEQMHDNAEKHGHDWGDIHANYADGLESGAMHIAKAMNNLPNHVAWRIGFRGTAEHEEENNGEEKSLQEYNHWDDKAYEHDLVHHAFNKHSAFDQPSSRTYRNNLSEISDEHLHDMLNFAHSEVDSARTIGPRTMEHHGALIDEANRRENQKHLDTIHGHVHDNPDYYESLENETGTNVFHQHPALSTTDPRKIHTRLSHNYGDMRNTSGDDIDEHQLAKHIGQHADEKLAHHFHENELPENDKHYYGFVQGLNKNPNGEKITHSLIDRFYMPDHEGRTTHINNRVSPPHTYTEPHHTYDDTLFRHIAQNTNHMSVLDRLSKRSDVPDDIKNEAKRRFSSKENMSRPLNEGHVGKALETLADSASDPLQKKFLHHLTIHLKKLLDPEYHFYKGHGVHEAFEDGELPAASYKLSYKELLEKLGERIRDEHKKDIFDVLNQLGYTPEDLGIPSNTAPVFGTFLQQAQDWQYSTDTGTVSEELKKKKKKNPEDEPTPVLINPDKDEI